MACTLPVGLLTGFDQRIQEQQPVLVVSINRLPPVPSVHHMIDRSRILNSDLASHNPTPIVSPRGGCQGPMLECGKSLF